MQIVMKPISDVRPYWRNPRKNEEAVEAVIESVEQFGIQHPILLDKEGVIIAGHTRYKAYQRLDIEQVPCVISEMDEKKAKAFRIIDNKTSEKAKWDWELLTPELREADLVKEFLGHFPELSIEPVPMSIDSITREDVQETEQELSNKFNHNTSAAGQKRQTISCPSCGEEIELL